MSASDRVRPGVRAVDGRHVPSGGVAAIDVFHDGDGPLANCLHPTDAVPNDPCVASRVALGGGDAEVTVLSSTGGVFTTVEPNPVACPRDPDTGREPVASAQVFLQLKDKTPDTKDQVRWNWSKGAAIARAGSAGAPRSARRSRVSRRRR